MKTKILTPILVVDTSIKQSKTKANAALKFFHARKSQWLLNASLFVCRLQPTERTTSRVSQVALCNVMRRPDCKALVGCAAFEQLA